MSQCPYRMDGIQCRDSFAHEGDHQIHVAGRDIFWPYPAYAQIADAARGYVACEAIHPDSTDIRGTWTNNLYCARPVGHEGDHEGDGWTVPGSKEMTHVHWGDEAWDDPKEPAPAKREVPKSVIVEQDRRAAMPTRMVAFQTPSGQTVRLEAVQIDVQDGILAVGTRDADYLYPAGSWGPLTMEVTEW